MNRLRKRTEGFRVVPVVLFGGAALCLLGVAPPDAFAQDTDAPTHTASNADSHANSHAHPAHGKVAPALDHGRKWATDEPLRKAMANIRDVMEAALPDIHGDRLTAAGYAALGNRISGEVDFMIRNCRLPPQADAQLHSIIAELLASAEAMKDASAQKRHPGAEKALGALEGYAARFDDPAWKPVR